MQEPSSPQRQHVTIVVDAMGGDNAPQAVVAGAVRAARALPDVTVILVGVEDAVRAQLVHQKHVPGNLIVRHASQVVEMCDPPGVAVRQKSDSSIVVGTRLVRNGEAQGIISAGNSGAMMAAATLILKLQPGIDRPAIATLMPTRDGKGVLLDAGATADCKPIHMVQFAQLGSAYARAVLDLANPRVGLLSIGEEPSKGNELTKEAHKLLLTSDTNFVGNVEPKELMRGEVDVVVCDGFVGNLMLKTAEGFGEMVIRRIATQFSRTWYTRLGAFLLKPILRQVRKVIDYAEYGGALLLGVNGVVLIGHGRSNAIAIENAVRAAVRAVEHHLADPLPAPAANELPVEGK